MSSWIDFRFLTLELHPGPHSSQLVSVGEITGYHRTSVSPATLPVLFSTWKKITHGLSQKEHEPLVWRELSMKNLQPVPSGRFESDTWIQSMTASYLSKCAFFFKYHMAHVLKSIVARNCWPPTRSSYLGSFSLSGLFLVPKPPAVQSLMGT